MHIAGHGLLLWVDDRDSIALCRAGGVSRFVQQVSDFAVLQGRDIACEVAAGAQLARGDAEMGAERLGQRLRAGVAVLKREGSNVSVGIVKELACDVFQTQTAHGRSRRFADNRFVDAVEMVRRQRRHVGKRGEVKRFAVMLFEMADDRA